MLYCGSNTLEGGNSLFWSESPESEAEEADQPVDSSEQITTDSAIEGPDSGRSLSFRAGLKL